MNTTSRPASRPASRPGLCAASPLAVATATALAALATALPAQSPASDTAVGVFPFLVGNMDGQIPQVVQRIADHDIDTIYVSVFRATGPRTGDLWVTDSSRTWNRAWGPVRPGGAGIDLPRLCDAAHLRGMRVVAVFKCFDATVQPTDASHRQYLLDVAGYFVDAFRNDGEPFYDVDGFALDYVRYVSAGTGNDPRPVTDFVRDFKQRIGGMSLHAYLLANRWSFDGPTYDGNFRSYSECMSILRSDFGQDWEALARWLDVFMPMAYTADGSIYRTYALHQAYVRQTASYSRIACSRAGFPFRRVQPVIRTYQGGSETATTQTVEASITGALLGGGDGYQAFRYGTVETAWWPKLQQYAVAGANFPLPDLAVTVGGLTADHDPTGSQDADEPATSLQARFDWDADGTFDTPWQALAAAQQVVRSPGVWRAALQVRDSDGHVATTRRSYFAGDVLTLSSPGYSASAGGPMQIRLDIGAGGAGATYLVLGSFSGSTPGFQWQPGFLLPLNPDGVTFALLDFVNTSVLQNGLGPLDPSGRATAVFSVPGGVLQAFVLRGVTWAALGVDTLGQPLFVSNAQLMVILP